LTLEEYTAIAFGYLQPNSEEEFHARRWKILQN